MKIYTNINEKIIKNCVATIGFFDGVHNGHKYIIEQVQNSAKKRGVEDLIISLWPHPNIIFKKPIELLSTYEEKIELFKRFNVKNLLFFEFNNKTAQMSKKDFVQDILINKLNISELLVGYNNSFGNKELNKDDEDINITTSRLEKMLYNDKEVNSSIIRKLLKNGQVDDAGELLGYFYKLSGTIVSGYRNGRKIGFPTANISVNDKMKLIPDKGVYIVEALIEDKWYPAMLNIGNRPSFNGTTESIELHIPNFSSNLYNKELTIRFRKKIRDEKQFSNIELLIKQLHKDKQQTMDFFA